MERDIKFKIGGSGEGQCIRTLLKILDQNCTYQEDPKFELDKYGGHNKAKYGRRYLRSDF